MVCHTIIVPMLEGGEVVPTYRVGYNFLCLLYHKMRYYEIPIDVLVAVLIGNQLLPHLYTCRSNAYQREGGGLGILMPIRGEEMIWAE